MSRLTEEELATIRERDTYWPAVLTGESPVVCGDRRKLLDEVDALRAERDAARELLKKLETTLPNLQRDVMADCTAQIAAMRVESERRGFEACREAAKTAIRAEAKRCGGAMGPWVVDALNTAENIVADLLTGTDRTQGSGT